MALKIALVSCVKNEEAAIGRLLKSVQGKHRFWDKLVITDTGSTDRTVEIAKEYGAEVIEAEWPNHFAEARNLAAQNAGDVDVVVNFDGDELLGLNGHLLRQKIEEQWALGKRMLGIHYEFSHDPQGNPTCTFTRQVIFCPKTFKWQGRVHEWLEGPRNQKTNLIGHISDVTLEHWPKEGWAQNKRERDLALLEQQVEEEPEKPRGYFYLGREYLGHQRYDEAISILERYLEIAHWNEERMQALLYLAECKIQTQRKLEGVRHAHEAMIECNYRREPYFFLCELAYNDQRWQSCVTWGEAAVSIPLNVSHNTFIVDDRIYTWGPHDMMAISYWNLKRHELGAYHLQVALSYRPNDQRMNFNKQYFPSHFKV